MLGDSWMDMDIDSKGTPRKYKALLNNERHPIKRTETYSSSDHHIGNLIDQSNNDVGESLVTYTLPDSIVYGSVHDIVRDPADDSHQSSQNLNKKIADNVPQAEQRNPSILKQEAVKCSTGNTYAAGGAGGLDGKNRSSGTGELDNNGITGGPRHEETQAVLDNKKLVLSMNKSLSKCEQHLSRNQNKCENEIPRASNGNQNSQTTCSSYSCDWQDECQLCVIVEDAKTILQNAAATVTSVGDMLISIYRTIKCYVMTLVNVFFCIFMCIFGNITKLKNSLLSLKPGSIGFYITCNALLSLLLTGAATKAGVALCVFSWHCYRDWLRGSSSSAECDAGSKGFYFSCLFGKRNPTDVCVRSAF